jgi:hypothetical protein
MLRAAKHLAADRERPFAALISSAATRVNGVTPRGNTRAMRQGWQHCQVLLNLALESEYIVYYVYAQLY